MTRPTLVLALTLSLSVTVAGQSGLDPAMLLRPPTDAWPTFNGDYSGRRYSALAEISQSTLDLLKIAWMYRIPGVGPQRGVGGPTIKSTPLLVNGVLYFTAYTPVSILIEVDLPAPLGPMQASRSPRSTSREMPRTASIVRRLRRRPTSKRRVSCRASIAGTVASIAAAATGGWAISAAAQSVPRPPK